MKYANIKKYDIANGPGVRVSLFVSGCKHHCKGCFNEIAWDFNYGKEFSSDVQDEIIAALKPDYIEGLTILGGEPFEPENQRGLLSFSHGDHEEQAGRFALIKRVREELPKKTIWAFSGFILDKEILGISRANCEVTNELLSLIDVLVDGRFEEDKKDIALIFKGSSNQRIIDLRKTLKEGHIVLSPLNDKKSY